jgi:hypothetical protein
VARRWLFAAILSQAALALRRALGRAARERREMPTIKPSSVRSLVTVCPHGSVRAGCNSSKPAAEGVPDEGRLLRELADHVASEVTRLGGIAGAEEQSDRFGVQPAGHECQRLR